MVSQETGITQIPSQFLPEEGSTTDVTLYLRSLAPSCSYSSQERLIGRVTTLRDRGVFEEVTVRVWGEQVCTEGELSTIPECSRIVESIGDFFALAAETSIDIGRFFTVKEVRSSLSGEHFRCITTPARCIAFSNHGSLVGVFPCEIDETVFKPEDALSQIEATQIDGNRQQRTT